MTAYWSAMVRNCMRQMQAKKSEKVDMQNYATSLKDRISMMQEQQNSIWLQNEMAASESYRKASETLQQRIAQVQAGDGDPSAKNTEIQRLQSELQLQKTQADMELQQMKRLWEQEQREQLKPLQNEQTRLETRQQKIDDDIEALKNQKEYYQAQNKESNQEFYGGGRS